MFFTKKFFLKHKKFYNEKSFAYKVDKVNFVDIDTKFDLEVAKRLKNLNEDLQRELHDRKTND